MPNIVEYKAKDGQQIELTMDTIKKYLVQGRSELVTTQEMIYFMGICKSRGMNPFARDCYLVKYSNDPAAIVTSIDYFRSRAKTQPDCRGWKSGVIVRDQETGNVRRTSGLVMDGEELIGGWFSARPEGWDYDFDLEVNLKGYIKKTKDGHTTSFWKEDNQPTMIRKVAESQGLRECWPGEFGKIYVQEEVDRAEMMDAFSPGVTINTAQSLTEDIKSGKHGGTNGEMYKGKDIPPATEPSVDPPQESEESRVYNLVMSSRGKTIEYVQEHWAVIEAMPGDKQAKIKERWAAKTDAPWPGDSASPEVVDRKAELLEQAKSIGGGFDHAESAVRDFIDNADKNENGFIATMPFFKLCEELSEKLPMDQFADIMENQEAMMVQPPDRERIAEALIRAWHEVKGKM